MLLLILAALPALALTIYNSFEQRGSAESQARGEIANLARIGAQQQSQIVNGAKQLLVGFSLVPGDLRNDRARCNEYVRQVLQKTAGLYSSMGLYQPDGEVKCAGSFLDSNAQRAAESGQLSIGEYPRAGSEKPAGFTLSYPIDDGQRNAVDVAFVVLNLVEFGEFATKIPLPEATALTVIDRHGVVLARKPGANDIVGRKLEAAQVPDNMLTGASGISYVTGVDGGRQLLAYETVRETAGGPAALRVLVSVPLSVVYAQADATLIRTLASVLAVTLLLLIGAWYGVDRFYLRNVRTLLNTANRIRTGDLTARTGMRYSNEELSQIGKAFDDMAETLQERQKRIDKAIVTLHQQSITDALTRLHNRRYLYETLPREIVRAKRNGATIAVIILDLDHFKRINDKYGHEAGDMALRWVGNVLMKSVRGSDIVCRHGGEEFCVALPEASQESALAKAEDIRRELEQLALDYCGQPLKITGSLGVAMYPVDGTDADSLLRLADEALYDAKAAGRNRVVAYGKDVAFRHTRLAAAGEERVSAVKPVSPMTSTISDLKPVTARRQPASSLHPVVAPAAPDRPAAIQVLTGSHAGKEFQLLNAASTLGKTGHDIAMITRTPNGYFITHLEGPKFPVINGSTIESRARQLADRDVVEVAGVKAVFFYK